MIVVDVFERPDTEFLERAVNRLEEGLKNHLVKPEDSILQDGLLLRWVRTYDLAYRLISTYLLYVSASPDEVIHLSFPELIRVAIKRGILRSELDDWLRYRKTRSEILDPDAERNKSVSAETVVELIDEARFLLNELTSRLREDH